MVGISVWNQPSDGVGLTRSSDIHRFRHASFTIRLVHTAPQCFDFEKYVLRLTKARVVCKISLCEKLLVRAPFTKAFRIGKKFLFTSNLVASPGTCSISVSKRSLKRPWVGVRKSRPQSGITLRLRTFISVYRLSGKSSCNRLNLPDV